MLFKNSAMASITCLVLSLALLPLSGCAVPIPPPGPKSSVAASLEIQGASVTPFTLDNQNLLINAFTVAMAPTVAQADVTIPYYTSDSTQVPTFTNSTSKRRLLSQEDVYQNTVFIALYINAGSTDRISTVMGALQAAVGPTGSYGSVPVQEALQGYGQASWSIQLLSSGNVDPNQPLAVELACKSKFDSFCLDGSGLSPGGVKGIIAAGSIVVVLVPALLCVFIDIRRKTGRMADGELSNLPETPHSPIQKAADSISHFLKSSFAAVKPALSMTGRHRRPSLEDTLPRGGLPGPSGAVPGAATATVVVDTSAAKTTKETTEKIDSQSHTTAAQQPQTGTSETEETGIALPEGQKEDRPRLPPIKTSKD